MRKSRLLTWCLSFVLILGLFTGCGGQSSMSLTEDISNNINGFSGSNSAPSMAPELSGDKNYEIESGSSDGTVYGQEYDDYLSSRKLVRTAWVNGETKEYNLFCDWLDGQVAEFKGYIENMSEDQHQRYSPRLYYSDYNSYDYYTEAEAGYYTTRSVSYVIRIPTEKLDNFLNLLGDRCNITSRSSNVEDITLSYVDTENRLKALQTEQDRLLELLETAENIEDIITLESKLSDLTWQIENYGSQLKLMDNQVDYSTVRLSINEVLDFTNIDQLPTNYLGRLWVAFKRGAVDLKDWFIELSFWLAENILVLALWGVIIYLIWKFTKKRRAVLKSVKIKPGPVKRDEFSKPEEKDSSSDEKKE